MQSEKEITQIKNDLRLFLKGKRKKINRDRRIEAMQELYKFLWPKLSIYPKVLSFASTSDEIDLSELNEALAKDKQLLLPYMRGSEIIPYMVNDLDADVNMTNQGYIEPNASTCLPVENREIGCILVPGLGFDTHKHRLGYGKGCFDRFLASVTHCPTYGVGFKEQQLQDPILVAAHDISLSAIYLF